MDENVFLAIRQAQSLRMEPIEIPTVSLSYG
jgi:hypothetical protein